MNDEVEMEVFRTGDYGAKGAYTAIDLQLLADDYQPGLLEAPLTFDHAQTGPAYGWVSRLRREGDRLVAVLKGVPEAVRELVRSGAYKRRSVELFQKLPQTQRPYLRAVSLLGAATPEVKGLRDICFSSAAECCEVELGDEPDEAQDQAPAPLEQEVSALKQQVRNAQLTALFADLRADGYCLASRDAAAIRQIFAGVGGAESCVQFSDGTQQAGLEWLGDFLRQGLLRVPAGQSQHQEPATDDGTFAQFSMRTDPQSMALHQRALVIQAESVGTSYRDALAAASRRQ